MNDLVTWLLVGGVIYYTAVRPTVASAATPEDPAVLHAALEIGGRTPATLPEAQRREVERRKVLLLRRPEPEIVAIVDAAESIVVMGPRDKAAYGRQLDEALFAAPKTGPGIDITPRAIETSKPGTRRNPTGKPVDPKARRNPDKAPLHETRIHAGTP